jgi:hypothetical protein
MAPLAQIKPNKGWVNLDLRAKGYLAAALVRTGQDNSALALAADFDLPGQKAYIYQWTALAQARAGRKEAAKASFDKAIELMTGADDQKPGQGTTSHNLACALALAGDSKAALKIAEGIQLSITWSAIAYHQAESGDFEGARKTAAVNEKGDWVKYTKNCKSISSMQAKAGQAAAVRDWVGKVNDPLLRACILVGAAEGLSLQAGKASTKR